MTKIVNVAEIDISVKGTQSIKEMNAELQDAEKNLKDVEQQHGKNSKQYDEAKGKVDRLTASMDRLNNEAAENSGAMKRVGSSANVMKTGMDKANNSSKMMMGSSSKLGSGLNSLSGAFGGAASGAINLGKQFMALLANPIVLLIAAIVAGLTLLFKAFTSTKKGGEEFEAVMDGIRAVIDVLRDRVLKAGKAIFKFLTGDFKGAFNDAREAISGFGDEIANEFEVARQASLKLAEIKDRMRDLSVERAKQNLEISKARELSMDETKSIKERMAAVEKAGKLETELENKNVQVLKEKLDTIRKINSQSDTSAEDLQKEADAEIALYQAQQSAADARLRLQREQKRLQNEAASKAKAAADAAKSKRDAAAKAAEEERKRKEREAAEAAKKAEEALKVAQEIDAKAQRERLERNTNAFDLRMMDLQDKYDKEKAILEEQGLSTLNLTKNFEEAKAQIVQESVDEQNRIAAEADKKRQADADAADAAEIQAFNEKWEAKEKILNAAYGTAANFSNLIGELGGQNIKVQKAQALIQVGIDTASAISSLVKMSQANPANAVTGGIAGGLQFASGLLQITANMAKAVNILKAPLPPLPPPPGDLSPPSASAPPPQDNRDNRVYVLETDITSAQSRVVDLVETGIVQ